MAERKQEMFAISVAVTSIEKSKETKKDKDSNFICKIAIETTEGKWSVDRTFKEFEAFHANLVINDSFRGLSFAKLPDRSKDKDDDAQLARRKDYTEYLSEILHRSVLLGHKEVQDFISAPEKVRQAAKRVMAAENIPKKKGQMKKEGEKWKGYKSRWFVLLPNYLLQYFENADAQQIGVPPKGSIDLTLATKILVYDKQSNPYSMGIKCPARVWKLQCDTESERDEWVQALRNLLQDPQHTGYIPDCSDMSGKPSMSAHSPMMNGSIGGVTKDNKQVVVMKAELDSMRAEKDREQIKAEAELEYKQALDLQRESIVKWKEKTQELRADLTKIERQREQTDKEQEEKVNALNDEIESLKAQNAKQKKELGTKDMLITKTQDAVKEMKADIDRLQKESEEQSGRIQALSAVLYKTQGDSVLKLKYSKTSKKEVVFVSQINKLFYYDVGGGNKAEMKYISVLSVSDKSDTINKNMEMSWFLVTGEKRVALFAAEDEPTKKKWVKFMKESLGSKMPKGPTPSTYQLPMVGNGTTDDDDDDRKEDE